MRRALVAAVAAALTTAAVLSASGIGATTAGTSKSQAKRAGATGPQGARQSGPPPTMAEVHAQLEKRRAALDEKLADKLGVGVEKLRDARDAVFAKQLAAAVKANRLTQRQADAIKACKQAPLTCDRSDLPAFGGMGHGGFGPMAGAGGDALGDLASELGVSTATLQSALRSVRPAGPRGWGPGGRRGPGMGMGGPGMGGPGMGGPGGGHHGWGGPPEGATGAAGAIAPPVDAGAGV